MSLGEEDDEPNRGAGPFASGEPMAPGLQGPAGNTSGPSIIPVIVSADGSASIDGIPVPVMGGESVDVAILDTLHGYARNRNSTVRAAISDPSAGYVAIVEVAPDGSSKLVEQRQEDSAEDAGFDPSVGLAGSVAPMESVGNAGPTGRPPRFEQPLEQPDFSDIDDDDDSDDADADADDGYDIAHDDDADEEDAVAVVPERARPRISAPALSVPNLGLSNVRKKILRQSDDEYEPPAFLKRPLGIGVAGVVAAAVVIVPLIMLGSSSGSDGASGQGQNQAAESSTVKDKTPPTPLELTPSYSPSPSPSLSPSPSRSPSPSASPSVSASPKAKTKPKATSKPTTKAKPKATPKAKAKAKATPVPGIPTGRVLLKNKKYGFCLDLPGEGSVGVDTRVQDYRCKPSGDNQDWVLDLVSKGGGTGGANLYLIRNVSSNLCLDLPNYGTVLAQTPVSVYHCRPGRETDNQLWWFQKRPNGTYWIRNQKSGDMCLDVARTNKTAETTSATVYPCNARDDHEWSFPKS